MSAAYDLFCDLYDDDDDKITDFVENCRVECDNDNLTLNECFILAQNKYYYILNYLNTLLEVD